MLSKIFLLSRIRVIGEQYNLVKYQKQLTIDNQIISPIHFKSMLQQFRDNFHIQIRREVNVKSQAAQRESILNCNVPQLKLLYFINRLRESQRGQVTNRDELGSVIRVIDQAIWEYPDYELSKDCLAMMMKLILKENQCVAMIIVEFLEYWFEVEALTTFMQTVGVGQRECQMTDRSLRMVKHIIKMHEQLSQYYFRESLDMELYGILMGCRNVSTITLASKIVVITLENHTPQNKQSLGVIIPIVLEFIVNYNDDIKLAGAKIIALLLSKSLIEIEGTLNQPCFCRALVGSLATQNSQLRYQILKIIGYHIFKGNNPHQFISSNLFDYLLESLSNPSIWILKSITWIVSNLTIIHNTNIQSQLLEHRLFKRLLECYNSMDDKHYFYRTLEKEISKVVRNIISKVEREKVWVIVMHYQLIDKIIMNFSVKEEREVGKSLELLHRLVEMGLEMGESWRGRIRQYISVELLDSKIGRLKQSVDRETIESLVWKIEKLSSVPIV